MAKTNDDMAIQTKALLAGGLAAAAAGAAWLLARKGNPADDDTVISDAPAWTLHSANQGARPIAAKTLLIGRSRPDLYEAWKDFARFPSFMENVEAIETLDATRSRWTIKAPAGKTVTLVTRIRDDIPNKKIGWVSEPDSDIATAGQVEFTDAPGDRGTYVSLVMSYDPPAGRAGQLIAKLFAREPNIQARHDLRRFKQLMETGEVTTNASPSARTRETPDQPHL